MRLPLLGSAALLLMLFWSPTARPAEPAPGKAGGAPSAAADWPWWRGPQHNGVADAQQQPPLKWSAKENIVWQSPVPGRGHGSPTVVGNQVFLAAADPEAQTQAVLCYDRQTGEKLWETIVHRGGNEKGGNGKSSLASSTVACDGKRLYINFLHDRGIYTTALDRAGKQLWQRKVTDYVLHQGFGSSPAIYRSLVLVSADNKGTGVIAGLDRDSGEVVWKHERPKAPNYASPIVLNVAGREQLFLSGCDLVTSLDPQTGEKIWEVKGSTTECVTSTVTDGQLIYTSGGYPRNHVAAVRADLSGKVVWENSTRVYVPSMLIRDGYLYAVTDGGVAICWKADTGKEVWKGRLGGDFSASPVLVGANIFASNEAGKTFVFKAAPTAFELIGENQLGDEALASAAICGGQIFMRVAVRTGGRRQEILYCVGEAKK